METKVSVIRLLVLGAVRQHGRAHGYQIRNDLEFWGAHEWSTAKPGSIYHALKQLAKEGLLLAHDTAPSTAGGPPRTEYEMTPAGDKVYLDLLREAVRAHDQKTDLLTTGVGFIVDLRRDEAIALLEERIVKLQEWRREVLEHWSPTTPPEEWGHIGEIMRLWIHNADSGVEWTRGLIRRLQEGAYVMADEGERSVEVLADWADLPDVDDPPGPDRGTMGR
nr:PadR family transcriptional regulator [Phytoactinopolyspora mesophila]